MKGSFTPSCCSAPTASIWLTRSSTNAWRFFRPLPGFLGDPEAAKKKFLVSFDRENNQDVISLPIFSTDNRHTAYIRRYIRGNTGKDWVIHDGKPGPKYERIIDFTFSPDGSRYAYIAQMLVEDLSGPPSEYFSIGLSRYYRNGKPSYLKNDLIKVVVIDGRSSREYDAVGNTVFSPDGRHLAYMAMSNEKQFLVLDGQKGQEYDRVSKNGPSFTPDGTIEYLAIKDGTLYRVKHVPDQEASRSTPQNTAP